MKRIDTLVQLGKARLERARNGEDFFQAIPQGMVEDDILTWYITHFGQIINTDCAKLAFLKDGYTPIDPASVAKFHPHASKIVAALVEQMLAQVDQQSVVIFMAGGNGAGKSTFCNGAKEGLTTTDWIIDATLASYDVAAQTLRRLLDKKAQVALVFIDRPKEDAWMDGVQKRAQHGSHQTPRNVFDMTHTIVPQNVKRLIEEFSLTQAYYHIANVSTPNECPNSNNECVEI